MSACTNETMLVLVTVLLQEQFMVQHKLADL